MKSISASIVLLSGAILLAVGSLVPSNEPIQAILQLGGGAVGLVGFVVWIRTLTQSSD